MCTHALTHTTRNFTVYVCIYMHTLQTDKVVYTAVTAGCPSAFRLKYKAGGLARMQVNSPLTNMGNFGPSPENKAFRANTLLGKAEDLMTKFTLNINELCVDYGCGLEYM